VTHCRAHDERVSATTCRRCGAECCESCLVFSFGEAKAPFCPPCALAVAGLDAVDECAADSRATASASTTA
jgi:hypothetical protein